MTIHILTLFPKMFDSIFSLSIINRAIKNNLVTIKIYNLRDWAKDKHKTVDDSPYGGGAGMVMKVDVIDRALKELKLKVKSLSRRSKADKKLKVILLTPQGKTYNQKMAKTLSSCSELLLICGHYEGFDERVRKLADDQISVGDYILTGGEIPAMVVADSIIRLLPGVLGKSKSCQEESFSMQKIINKDQLSTRLDSARFAKSRRVDPRRTLDFQLDKLIEYPQFTRPEKYKPKSINLNKSLRVPKILLSGNHEKIKSWRIKESIKKSQYIA